MHLYSDFVSLPNAHINNNLEVGKCELSVSVHKTHVTTSESQWCPVFVTLEVLTAMGE